MGQADENRGARDGSKDETRRNDVMEGPHGGHGGSLESEGGPQEQQPHAPPPIERRPGEKQRRDAGEDRDDTPPQR